MATITPEELIEKLIELEKKVSSLESMLANEYHSGMSQTVFDIEVGKIRKKQLNLLTQAKEQWCREQKNALKSALQMLEQTLTYRMANNLTGGNVFLESTIDEVRKALNI